MPMSRLTPYLGILASLALFSLVVLLADKTSSLPRPVNTTPVASSTLFIPPGSPLSPRTLPNNQTENISTSSLPSPQPTPAPKQTIPAAPVQTPEPVAVQTTLNTSAIALRTALVNIICYAPANGVLHSISGGGVMIDPRGIILTNAHVAQYFFSVIEIFPAPSVRVAQHGAAIKRRLCISHHSGYRRIRPYLLKQLLVARDNMILLSSRLPRARLLLHYHRLFRMYL